MRFLKPTARIRRRGGKLPDILIQFLDTRSSRDDGVIDEVLYQVLGCNATPVWVSVASLRPIMQEAEMLT